MRRFQKKGYIMILALLMMTLTGMAIIILNLGIKSILYESNRVYFEACSRNLNTSGYAWAQQAAVLQSADLSTEITNFDIEAMNIPRGSLSVQVVDPNAPGIIIEITTTCGQGTMMLRRSQSYLVTVDKQQ
jgi:hypothetical protein